MSQDADPIRAQEAYNLTIQAIRIDVKEVIDQIDDKIKTVSSTGHFSFHTDIPNKVYGNVITELQSRGFIVADVSSDGISHKVAISWKLK
jgi:hypothetical protein